MTKYIKTFTTVFMFFIPKKILYYKSRNQKTPFTEWARSLDSQAKEVVYDRLEKVQIGYFGDYKNLGEGVYELRIHLDCGYRIYFGREGASIIILLCGGDKGSQKKDIKKAKFFWEDYQNAKKN